MNLDGGLSLDRVVGADSHSKYCNFGGMALKSVQARLLVAPATTTLATYHPFPPL
jgi:hypothetical protein